MDFIRKWGAMKGLFSDDAKAQTSLTVKDICSNIILMKCKVNLTSRTRIQLRDSFKRSKQ
eukprot:5711714-Ditylum_brightwellii.AAC.1